MILNKTPIRTSNNYKINDINVEVKIPKMVKEFSNLIITGDTSKYEILNNVSKNSLTYGNSKELEEQIYKQGNKNIKISDINPGELYLDFCLNENGTNLLENIEIETNTKSTIYINYNSIGEQKYFHNGIIRVKANPNSFTKIIIINMLNNKSDNFLSIENLLKENSLVEYTIVDFGGKTNVTNYYSNLKENNAKNNINTIYLGKENQIFDINYIANLFGENTDINIEVQGALKDKAQKNFKGTIDFKKGCKKARGNENEFCMLLSDNAHSKALPMLLCTEEDVEGNHSSAAGKIDEDKLFYIMSRGISEKDAMKLIVRARFNNILETIENEEIKEKIIKEIESKLD